MQKARQASRKWEISKELTRSRVSGKQARLDVTHGPEVFSFLWAVDGTMLPLLFGRAKNQQTADVVPNPPPLPPRPHGATHLNYF